MTDETTPGDAPTPATPDAASPPEAAPTDAAPTDATPTEPTPTVATANPAPAEQRKGIFVPRWLAILLGIVIAVGLVGGGGFALGRSTADDDHDDRPAAVEDDRNGPGMPPPADRGPQNGPGDRPGNGDDSDPAPPGPVSGVYLGVAVEDADGGARIVRVASGSPADEAGLEVGDVITEIDGTTVDDAASLAAAVQERDAGDEVSVTVERDGTSTDVSVTLGDRSSSSS